ncbi:hypothetical protein PSHT_13043 [Puccinia striiformis]|uniref:Uncharacterized protein n=1 Tax=Puccinia striiformis TaxID=27350 RepID=A0A2S4UT13_9BASI|nr:hypothetical protein PSHT_13043 [Puccinia striiformis]
MKLGRHGQKKQEEKAAITQLRLAEKAAQATHLKWSEESLLSLFILYDHNTIQEGMMGFLPFGKYFLAYHNQKGGFPLLDGVENPLLPSRYHTLMGTWRMHGNNPAATAHGQGDIKDNIGELCEKGMSDATIDESTGYLRDELLDEAPRTCVPRRSRRGRNPSDVLTPEELALDRQSSPPPDAHPSGQPSRVFTNDLGRLTCPLVRGSPPGLALGFLVSILPAPLAASLTPLGSIGPADTGANPGLPTLATLLAPGAINPAAPDRPIARPPTVPAASRSIPCCRGRTEETPKKDDSTGAGMLMMMQKPAEQTNMWMMEERKRAEVTRVEDRRDAEAKAALKEEIRNEQRLLMKQEREDALEQAHQDCKAADDRAALAEQVRKEERQDAIKACCEDTCRYEATQLKQAEVQAAQEKSRQMHEMTMMAILGNLAGPNPIDLSPSLASLSQ